MFTTGLETGKHTEHMASNKKIDTFDQDNNTWGQDELSSFGRALIKAQYPQEALKLLASPRWLLSSVSDAGTVGLSETDLCVGTIEGNSLVTNGGVFSGEYAGSFVGSPTDTRQIKLYFNGSVVFDSGTLTVAVDSTWTLRVFAAKVDDGNLKFATTLTTEGAALGSYVQYVNLTGQDTTSPAEIKVTGTAAGSGVANDDIVARMGYVMAAPAN